MPCNCDHMKPRLHEKESNSVAKHIVYVNKVKGYKTPAWVRAAANDVYGNEAKVHELTAMLCEMCSYLTHNQQQTILYDGRNPDARKLATWWDAHQEADRVRIKREKKQKEKERIKKKALDKLTVSERKALGIKHE